MLVKSLGNEREVNKSFGSDRIVASDSVRAMGNCYNSDVFYRFARGNGVVLLFGVVPFAGCVVLQRFGR